MRFVWNILAVLGLVAVLGLGFAAWTFRGFDPGALSTYTDLVRNLASTGNAAEATVWKRKVADGLSFKEVDESIREIANSNNIRDVGALPLGDEVSNMMGKPWRKLKIYLYCNPLTAAKMVDFSDAYSAYLPCRVALLEDKKGQLWIYSLNMDMMIHGGTPLPPDLKKEANHVKKIILDVMDRGSKGDF